MYKIHGYKDKKDKNEKKEGLNEFRVIRNFSDSKVGWNYLV